jgi:predicted metal-dependent hydrolase
LHKLKVTPKSCEHLESQLIQKKAFMNIDEMHHHFIAPRLFTKLNKSFCGRKRATLIMLMMLIMNITKHYKIYDVINQFQKAFIFIENEMSYTKI